MKTLKKFIVLTMVLAVSLLLATAFVACNKPCADGAHVWVVISNTATCTTAGEKVSKCSKCGQQKTEASAPLSETGEHDFDMDNVVTTLAATCEHAGEGTATCKRCNVTQTVEIPKLPHDFDKPDFSKMKPATCTQEGQVAGHCRLCGKDVAEPTPALGHDFTGASEIVQDATCTTAGERQVVCKRPNCDGDGTHTPAVSSLVIPALGHDWQTYTTLDVEPTYTEQGELSVHCNRCTMRDKVEKVPVLVAGQAREYKFRLVRPNMEVLGIGLSGIKITIKNAAGAVVAESSRANFANGVMTASLVPDSYTATIEGLPAGYYADQSYTINEGSVQKDFVINASLQPIESLTSSTKYNNPQVGSVLHNYTFKNLHSGGDVTLEQLLATHKIVLLNFFYLDCGACQTEMPYLLSAYNLYKDDVAVVMLDVQNYDSPSNIKTRWIDYYNIPDSIYVVQDQTPDPNKVNIEVHEEDYNNIANKFGFTAAPQNVIIDKQGVVCYVHTGAASEMTFRNLFKKYTSYPYYQEQASNEEEPSEQSSEQPSSAQISHLHDVLAPKKEEL